MFTKTPIEPNAIYSREETAHLLNISLSTLKQLIRTGQLKVSQPAGLRRVFIRGTSILEMLDHSERLPDTYLAEKSFSKNSDSKRQLSAEKKHLRNIQTASRRRSLVPTKKTARASGGANR